MNNIIFRQKGQAYDHKQLLEFHLCRRGRIQRVQKAHYGKVFSLSRKTDIIMFLANNPGYDTAADISKVRRILKSQVSVSVKSLCEKGLLTGTYKDGNKKSVHLSLTAKAKPVVTYGKKEQSDFAAVLFDGFTDEEIAAFERYHIKILDNINRKRSDK